MEIGATAFLLTGYAETASEREMLQHNLSADVLYIGHHGSSSSTTQEFLNAVNPSIAVISLGAGNSYGHPHKEVIQRLENAGITIYRTDLNGNIVIKSDGSAIQISTRGAH